MIIQCLMTEDDRRITKWWDLLRNKLRPNYFQCLKKVQRVNKHSFYTKYSEKKCQHCDQIQSQSIGWPSLASIMNWNKITNRILYVLHLLLEKIQLWPHKQKYLQGDHEKQHS